MFFGSAISLIVDSALFEVRDGRSNNISSRNFGVEADVSIWRSSLLPCTARPSSSIQRAFCVVTHPACCRSESRQYLRPSSAYVF